MKVLVTGGTGFIGSYLIKRLLKEGHTVSVLVRSNSSLQRIEDVINMVKIIEVDYTNLEASEDRILMCNAEMLFHLGWYGVENSLHNDDDMISVNLKTSISLSKIVLKSNIKTVIALGSQAEYGPYHCVIHESCSTNPTTLYGIAKLSAYNIFNYYMKSKDIRFVWLRLFSSYGPSDNDNWLIPYLIKTLANGKSPILTKGEQIWDYIYIDDVINAIIACFNTNYTRGIYNIGSGIGYPLKMVVTKIRNMVNPNIKLNFGELPYKQDQIMVLQADNTKLKMETGWQPLVELEKGLEYTVKWYLKFK